MNYSTPAYTPAIEPALMNVALKLYAILVTFGVELASKKICAIKELRTQTGCGLREAKDAWEFVVEDGGRKAAERERQRAELNDLEAQRLTLDRRIADLRAALSR